MNYIHGYSSREAERLQDQSNILEDLLHSGTHYEQGELVLEAGCGIGAQTKILARRNPESRFISIDISDESLRGSFLENVVVNREILQEYFTLYPDAASST